MNRPRRTLLGVAAALLAAQVAAAEASALVCVGAGDEETAAMEAVGGDHPLWADAYVIGRISAIDRATGDDLQLTLNPTHAFGDAPRGELRLATRSDGPPDPSMWAVGDLYFVSLTGFGTVERADAAVAGCAPNFRITDGSQIDRLVDAATSVSVLDPDVVAFSTVPPQLIGAVLGASILGLASVRAFRGRRREG